MKFKNFLLEEMPNLPSKFKKEFEELGKTHEYHKKNTDIFPEGVDTIYIPVPGFHTTELYPDLQTIVNDAIGAKESEYSGNRWGYSTDESIKVKKKVIDYKLGIITFTLLDKNAKKERTEVINIGDLVHKYARRGKKKIFDDMWKYSAFRKGPTFDNLALAISRSPEQVGAMSTSVGWKSCMNLHKGACRHYTRADVKEGTVIAYFIDANDKKILYPIGRVLMKPFINSDGKRILKIGTNTYGDFPKIAMITLEKWLKKAQKPEKGNYRRPSSLYSDRENDWHTIGKSEVFKVGDRVRLTNLNDEDKKPYNYGDYIKHDGVVRNIRNSPEGKKRIKLYTIFFPSINSQVLYDIPSQMLKRIK